MNNPIKISVIIPCFNASTTIERCILSVCNQSSEVYEIIIIDDGSSDESVRIIESTLSSISIRNTLIKQENSGPSLARNNGVAIAAGTYIAFLDSDDEWLVDHISSIQTFLSTEAYKIVATKYQGAPINYSGVVTLQRLYYKNYFLTPCVVIEKKAFLALGGFDTKIKYAEDYKLWLNVCVHYPGYLIDYIGSRNQHSKRPFGEKGLSSNLSGMHQGVIHSYKSLYNKGLLSKKMLIKLYAFEKLKYLRRILISKI